MKRVGIYSGTFDPVHAGHIAFAEAAIAHAKLDKVFFLIEPRPRYKQGVRALEHRIAMVNIALSSHPKLGSIILEQSRFSVEDTLPVIRERFKGAHLYMLMGDDVAMRLPHWPHVGELIQSVDIIVGLRKKSPKQVGALLDVIRQTNGLDISCEVFRAPSSLCSSSDIRQSLRRGEVPDYLDPHVYQYIRQHRLYRPSTTS